MTTSITCTLSYAHTYIHTYVHNILRQHKHAYTTSIHTDVSTYINITYINNINIAYYSIASHILSYGHYAHTWHTYIHNITYCIVRSSHTRITYIHTCLHNITLVHSLTYIHNNTYTHNNTYAHNISYMHNKNIHTQHSIS